ncbi:MULTISPECIES: 30S ribosomal protein S3ae [Halolamina]|uniref:Small ribosomal subunit protein eS1 n=1 Tax=Halolamina pelagica TaxID=699431 RepID=A0A1I5NWT2_9EURY|nr:MULTISPECIES: 30S ribosomal protein S3ae [Halolamina]NHX36510.1 30S ribosomal protein S3ae [Halolamina sp. R1-12]SFP26090.1 small subunit ribosomal protein S3Ae [Halolamina pelagica]
MSETSNKVEGKRWYTVLAPEQFDRAEIGETVAEEPNQVVGRTIETTQGEMEGDQGQNNSKLTFKINDVGSDAAYTEFIQYELTRDYLRSLVRRGASKVAATVTLLTTDDYRVKIQPVALTTQKADRSQEQAIRSVMVDIVEDAAEERTFEQLVDSVVEGRVSSAIYGEAKEIYPLRRVEVQKLSLEARPEEVEAEEEASVDVDEEDADLE